MLKTDVRRLFQATGYVTDAANNNFLVGQPYINASGQVQLNTGVLFEGSGQVKLHGLSTQAIQNLGYRIIIEYI